MINIPHIENKYKHYKEDTLFGRWIVFSDILPLLKIHNTQQIGVSENNTPIYGVKFGTGKIKILIWSQMHGNESTGTKALFDLFNALKDTQNPIITTILKECTLYCIPMLNPDGALAYTRVNANNIDLNRDAVAKKATESRLLRSVLDTFNPQFCFNLHDQRTIFGVEGTKNPATISFLAPSEEETRAITNGRKQTMDVIVAMNNLLQKIIPNQVGRYTDEFYPTATGDNFQKLGYNTILIEAGHYKDDYDREEVRKFNFYALLQGIYHIATVKNFNNYQPYFEIPNNVKNFYDVIYVNNQSEKEIAYQYENKVINGEFKSVLKKQNEKNLSFYFGHAYVLKKK